MIRRFLARFMGRALLGILISKILMPFRLIGLLARFPILFKVARKCLSVLTRRG